MNRLFPALALAAAAPFLAGAGASAADDPLHSTQCEMARAQLEQLLSDPQTRRGVRLERARQRAADVCLGQASGKPQRSGAGEPPQVVPPPTFGVPRPPPPLVPPSSGPPPMARPATITSCDAAGCWDSEGRRLNQIGPFLVGPGGVCNLQGNLVSCP